MKKMLCMVLSMASVLAVTSCTTTGSGSDSASAGTSDSSQPTVAGTYTYKSYTSALGTNWNPHTWESSADSAVLDYISSPFVDMSIKDSENGVYQWVYEMATAVTDVTAQHQADLTRYNSTLPAGTAATAVTEGYVFDIDLNMKAKWENGTAITADDYVYSMQQLLNPDMKNYRANLYISGESAIAGAYDYYYSKDEGSYVDVASAGFETNAAALAAGKTVYVNMHDFWGLSGSVDADGNECPKYVDCTDTTKYRDTSVAEGEDGDWVSAKEIYDDYGSYLEVGAAYAAYVAIYKENNKMGVGYDTVGLYKVDDDTIRYVLQTPQDRNYFLTSLTSTWLVYKDLYEAGFDTAGELKTTNYCSSLATTMSYGPYKLESLQSSKQMVLVQNPNWYGYTEKADGTLYSETQFDVDGKKVQQYKTTKVVIDVMTDAAAKQMFLSGDLSEWAPQASELSQYTLSDQLYQTPETYTMSFFFNTNEDALKAMDASKGNTNSVVLINEDFRKAFSLSIDRTQWVTATAGYKPSYSVMNDLYYYDIYEDPTSSYRASDEAMKAICEVYGVEYGAGHAYATLEDAYDSINGYNLTEAKALMKKACDALVADGKYTKGAPITIKVAYKKGALESDDNAQMKLMNQYINAAAADSGFGTITLSAVGNIADRYGDVPAGEYAIGYGAWGGAAFYPFRNFQVYMDPDSTDLNEAACWDPTTEQLTLTVDGQEYTMTYQAWSNALIGTGVLANASNDVKLNVTAQLEKVWLEKYYRIPLASSASCFLMSYQLKYYTENYNIMYGYGGIRLLDFNYTDAEWAAYVSSQNGQLSYN